MIHMKSTSNTFDQRMEINANASSPLGGSKKSISKKDNKLEKSYGPVVANFAVAESFPFRLHQILEDADMDPVEKEIIFWQPHGKSFVIKDNKKFADTIMPRYFNKVKFTSFQRQLNLYEFQRIHSNTKEKNTYYHRFFVRGSPELCHNMLRKKLNGKRVRRSTKFRPLPEFCQPSTVETFPTFSHVNDGTKIAPLQPPPPCRYYPQGQHMPNQHMPNQQIPNRIESVDTNQSNDAWQGSPTPFVTPPRYDVYNQEEVEEETDDLEAPKLIERNLERKLTEAFDGRDSRITDMQYNDVSHTPAFDNNAYEFNTGRPFSNGVFRQVSTVDSTLADRSLASNSSGLRGSSSDIFPLSLIEQNLQANSSSMEEVISCPTITTGRNDDFAPSPHPWQSNCAFDTEVPSYEEEGEENVTDEQIQVITDEYTPSEIKSILEKLLCEC